MLLSPLDRLKSDSIGLEFISNQPDAVQKSIDSLTHSLRNHDFNSIPAPALEGLRTFTRFTANRNGETQFWCNGDDKALLRLGPEFLDTIPKPAYQRGETLLYGIVESVGGVNPRAKLRIASDQVVYADVSEEQGRALGAALYNQTVSLRGQATWNSRTGNIVYFRVVDIIEFSPGSVRSAFEELRKSTKGAYDITTNVDHLASQIREGELPYAAGNPNLKTPAQHPEF